MLDTKIANERAPRGSTTGASVADLEPKEALTFLRERLAKSRVESGRLILVSGNVASGKTQLLSDFVDIAVRDGVRVLSATGAADEQTLAGGIIDQLLAGPDVPQATAEQAERIVETFHGATRGGPADEPKVTAYSVWRLAQILLNLARVQPMVIVVDNVHLADRTSVLLLQHLQRRLRWTRLTIVLSLRDRPVPVGVRTHFSRHTHHHLRLTSLSEHAVRDLLGDCAGDVLPSLIHGLSAGIPMLVGSLIEDYLTTGGIGDPESAGSAFSTALVSYLDRWDLPVRQVAGSIAVFGGAISTEVIAGLTGIATGVAEEVIEALTGSGLMAGGRFRHAAIESAAFGGLSPQARASAHLRAADLKFQQAAPPKEVAAHLIAADSGEARWALAVLRKAAEQAVADDQVDFAKQCLELALPSATTDADRRSILGALARCTWRVSPFTSRLYLDSLPEPPSDGVTSVGRVEAAAVAREVLWQGDEAAYRGRWETLAARVDAQTETELRLGYEWWFGPTGTGLPEPARGTDPWRLTATALSTIWWRSGNEASTAAAERILASCRLDDDSLEALMTAVLALVYANKMEEARTWWCSLKAEADRRSAVTWQAMLSGMWSGVVLRGGNVPYAVELARHALSLLPAQDWGAAVGDPLTTLLLAYTGEGEYDRAAEVLTQHVPDSMYRTVAGIRYVRARGQYRMATGRLLAAVSDFQECRRLLAVQGSDLAVIAPWRADLAAANLRLENVDAARKLAGQQLELAAGTDPYTRGLSLRVLALAGEPGNLQATLRQAAEKFAESGDRWEAERTARMLECRIAVPSEDQTAQRFSGAGFLPPPRTPVFDVVSRNRVSASVVSAGLSATARTDRDSGGAELISAAEMRVAELAAHGLTNQEISSSLFITVSTVEQHLTRVYRKLGIRSRNFLAARLGTV
jgi:DNA-binding CsgD family transcriptional regulator